MGILRINAQGARLAVHDSNASLATALAPLADHPDQTNPIIVMIHGYKFAPGHVHHCPHQHILSRHSTHPSWKAVSWPHHLGLSATGPQGIAFGWQARGSIWQAYDQAETAGQTLAALIRQIHRIAPHRPIRAIAHSLGARVLFCALPHLPAGALERALLLAPAEYRSRAALARATPAGQLCDIVTTTSRENAAFDHVLGWLIPRPTPTTASSATTRQQTGAGLRSPSTIPERSWRSTPRATRSLRPNAASAIGRPIPGRASFRSTGRFYRTATPYRSTACAP